MHKKLLALLACCTKPGCKQQSSFATNCKTEQIVEGRHLAELRAQLRGWQRVEGLQRLLVRHRPHEREAVPVGKKAP